LQKFFNNREAVVSSAIGQRRLPVFSPNATNERQWEGLSVMAAKADERLQLTAIATNRTP
jgi:hypothetical protein